MKTGENWGKLVKTGENWKLCMKEIWKIDKNCGKSRKTAENWGKLGKIGENWGKLEGRILRILRVFRICGNFGQFWAIFRYLFQNSIRQNSFNSNSMKSSKILYKIA